MGVIPLEKEKGAIWMTQNKPVFFGEHADKKKIAELFNLLPDDIADRMPIEEVSTGNRMLIVPIKTLRAIQDAQCDVSKMRAFFGSELVGPYTFSLETTDPSAAIHTRFFAPHLGILEDPATGSAAGPLTGYLLKHRVFGDSFEILNEQGVEMGRPSKILMRGSVKDDDYCIQVGGNCAYVGKAEFEI
jgi:trans-2,3-dihydro-3-hydroxyanthranilate isomerase